MDKDRNQELERILAEINSSIRSREPEGGRRLVAVASAEEERKPEKKPAPESGAQRPAEAPAREKPRAKSGAKARTRDEEPAKKPAENPEPAPEAKVPAEDAPAPEAQKPRSPRGGKREKPSEASRREKKDESLKERLEDTAEAAGEFIEEERNSFLESARIIEDELEDGELRDPAVRHIAVTAAEVIPEAAVEKKRRAFDQQKALTGEKSSRNKHRRMSKRERTTAILGALVTVFVVIGVVSTVLFSVRGIRDLVNSTAKKEELAKAIFPLVIVDIPQFDTPEALDNAAIIQSSIWAFIIDEQDKSKYPKDDMGAMTVPDTDIEPYIRRLYGNDVEIVHQSIDDTSVQMLYDSENKRYIIESTPRFLPYTPRVDKIVKSGDIYTLTVSYVLPDALWNLESDHTSATVDKVMEYRVKRNTDAYQMLSVKLISVTGRNESETSGGLIPDAFDDEGYFEENLSSEETLPSSAAASSEGTAPEESGSGEAASGEAVSGETGSEREAASDEASAGSGEESSED